MTIRPWRKEASVGVAVSAQGHQPVEVEVRRPLGAFGDPAGDTLAAADCVLILTSHSQFDYWDSPSGLRWSSTRATR